MRRAHVLGTSLKDRRQGQSASIAAPALQHSMQRTEYKVLMTPT
ncbi:MULTISPECIES: hypothetical protein [unclassified Streptomyces]